MVIGGLVESIWSFSYRVSGQKWIYGGGQLFYDMIEMANGCTRFRDLHCPSGEVLKLQDGSGTI